MCLLDVVIIPNVTDTKVLNDQVDRSEVNTRK